MGATRRQHHAQQEAMRAATTEANRQKEMMEQQQKAFEEQLQLQRDAMMAQTEAMREAMAPVKTTGATKNVGVRTAQSQRKTVSGLGKGVSSLRIPLNVGGTTGSGLNIG
jgi:hypothetical protein